MASWLLALGLGLLGVGGAFLPWIWYEPVALQLTAPGLAEFVKFLPQVRYGQVPLQRLLFLLPLFVALLVLPLISVNQSVILPGWLRWVLRLLVLPLALAALSPVWTPAILIAPEFRLQTLLAGLAVSLAAIAPVFKNLPVKLLLVLVWGGGLAALILPLWQFSLIQAGLSEAYHQPVSLGWGGWLTEAGIILSLLGATWIVLIRAKSGTDPYDRQAQTAS
jgi:hypothetical protein